MPTATRTRPSSAKKAPESPSLDQARRTTLDQLARRVRAVGEAARERDERLLRGELRDLAAEALLLSRQDPLDPGLF